MSRVPLALGRADWSGRSSAPVRAWRIVADDPRAVRCDLRRSVLARLASPTRPQPPTGGAAPSLDRRHRADGFERADDKVDVLHALGGLNPWTRRRHAGRARQGESPVLYPQAREIGLIHEGSHCHARRRRRRNPPSPDACRWGSRTSRRPRRGRGPSPPQSSRSDPVRPSTSRTACNSEFRFSSVRPLRRGKARFYAESPRWGAL